MRIEFLFTSFIGEHPQALMAKGKTVELVDKIAEEINDNAWNRCDPSLDDCGDYDYSDHDSNDSGNSAIEFSRTQVHDRLLVFLRERHRWLSPLGRGDDALLSGPQCPVRGAAASRPVRPQNQIRHSQRIR